MSNTTTPIDDSVIPEYVKLQEGDGTVYWYSTNEDTKIYIKPTANDNKILIPIWILLRYNFRTYWVTTYEKLDKNHEIVKELALTKVNPYSNRDKLSREKILTPTYIEFQDLQGNKYWYNRLNSSKVHTKPTEDVADIFIPEWENDGEDTWFARYHTFKSVPTGNFEFLDTPQYVFTSVNPNKLEGGKLNNKKTKCKKTKCKKPNVKKTKCKKL
jgi:hypothetical protein